jgi:hypothetical protein
VLGQVTPIISIRAGVLQNGAQVCIQRLALPVGVFHHRQAIKRGAQFDAANNGTAYYWEKVFTDDGLGHWPLGGFNGMASVKDALLRW